MSKKKEYKNVTEIVDRLKKQNYLCDSQTGYAVMSAINGTPLLIEGEPGTGKTTLAEAVAKMMGLELIRVQFYEGITADKILYDYDYQRQLLTIEAMRPVFDTKLKDMELDEAMKTAGDVDFYDKGFLIERPLLKAISGKKRYVLLLDEIDKSSEEIEFSLLETLDTYSMSIPQYGTVTCPDDKKPIVFITSNNYRELSDAFRRRCNYLYIYPKTVRELTDIITAKTKVNETLAAGIAKAVEDIRELPLRHKPSTAEAVLWASYCKDGSYGSALDAAKLTVIKDKEDIKTLESDTALISKIIQFRW